MAIGPWPEVSLAKARHIRDVNRIKLAEGIDPMMERKRAKNEASFGGDNTFAAVAREYIEHKMVGEGRAEAPCSRRAGSSICSSLRSATCRSRTSIRR